MPCVKSIADNLLLTAGLLYGAAFPAAQLIYDIGDDPSHFYIILSGRVDMWNHPAGTHRCALWLAGCDCLVFCCLAGLHSEATLQGGGYVAPACRLAPLHFRQTAEAHTCAVGSVNLIITTIACGRHAVQGNKAHALVATSMSTPFGPLTLQAQVHCQCVAAWRRLWGPGHHQRGAPRHSCIALNQRHTSRGHTAGAPHCCGGCQECAGVLTLLPSGVVVHSAAILAEQDVKSSLLS